MPTLIELFLSKYIILLLVWMYLASAMILLIGFRMLKIKHRFDVIMRGIIMHGTYIFLCHAIGIMFMIIIYIFMTINTVEVHFFGILMITLFSGVISNLMYVISANFLWERLAIGKRHRRDLVLYGLILATPWYYFLNLL